MEPTTSKGVNPNETKPVEHPLPPSAELDLEVDDDIIVEVAREVNGVKAPIHVEPQKRRFVPHRNRSKMLALRPRHPISSSNETFGEVSNSLLK